MLRYKTKTRPGLVALYDIQPGNGAGPFLQPRSPHGAQTGFVGKGSDHLQLIKFRPSRALWKGVCSGAKFFGSALLQPAPSVCVSSERFFH